MIMNELTAVPTAAMPITAFSEHLHLGSGFADDGAQDAVLEAYLRAALAAIEARIGIALFERRFSWHIHSWSAPDHQRLPIRPVAAVGFVRLINKAGQETMVDPSLYRLRNDSAVPLIETTGNGLPSVPFGGSIEVVFDAGYGAEWSNILADLGQAVLKLAAHYYENRMHSGRGAGGLPESVLSLLEPHRSFRVFGGSA